MYAVIIIILLFIPSPTRTQREFLDLDIKSADAAELNRYEEYLRHQLGEVKNALSQTRVKRNSPLSATLPNRESAYFLDRIGALKKKLNLNKTATSESVDPIKPNFLDRLDTANDTKQECKQLSQPELVAELKQRGTYNPELMAWDAYGVIRFLDRTIHDQYQKQTPTKNKTRTEEVVERNIEALARLLDELNVTCNVNSAAIKAKLQNLTFAESRRSIISPSLRRVKRMDDVDEILSALNASLPERQKDQPLTVENDNLAPRQKLVGESHIVPFGCDKRGAEEDGYLRLCGACQAIRRLPDTFFPPFINEVTCDTDKACLYFYDYPHGKCRQKHMNFVVLRNIGTKECQIWKKFNLNVRVSCECFVDEMSFFAKYV